MYLYFLNTNILNINSLFTHFYNISSHYRQQKIDAFHFRKDKNLSLGAAVLLEQALQTHGLHERNMIYSLNPNHKPFFQNVPQLHFNISHSDELVIAAFGNQEVGCDVEQIRKIDLDIAQKFFTQTESKYISSFHNQEDQIKAFYRLWTLKESFIKYTGLGADLPMNAFCISFQNNIPNVSTPQKYNDIQFVEKTIDNYQISVCAKDLTNIYFIDAGAICTSLGK